MEVVAFENVTKCVFLNTTVLVSDSAQNVIISLRERRGQVSRNYSKKGIAACRCFIDGHAK